MADPLASLSSTASPEALVRAELARADAAAGAIAPVLRHLLVSEDHSLFGDDVIARVRGMVADLARQLCAGGEGDVCRRQDSADLELLPQRLVGEGPLVSHLHALAIEWQMTERLQARRVVDPVLPPLLQALIASSSAATAEAAMKLLAAQARFGQAQRRMALPLGELPGDLFHATLLARREVIGGGAPAEDRLRAAYDEAGSRLGLIARLVNGMGGGAIAALSVGHAGAAIFLSALSSASGLPRDLAALALHESQAVRLGLALAAAGLGQDAITEQFLEIHAGLALPAAFDRIPPETAAALLGAGAARYRGRA